MCEPVGYIKLFRETLYKLGDAAEFAVFIRLLLLAEWRDGNPNGLPVGEAWVSQRELSQELKLGPATMGRVFRQLMADERIEILETNQRFGTRVRVVNFADYQGLSASEEKRSGKSSASEEKRSASEEKRSDGSALLRRSASASEEKPTKKKEYSKKEEGGARTRFTPPTRGEVEEYAKSKGYAIDVEHFLAHHEARGWILSNGRKPKSWKSCVVTWAKKEAQYGGKSSANQRDAHRAKMEEVDLVALTGGASRRRTNR